MTVRAVGYDPGTRNAKAAVLERRGEQWVLLGAAIAPVDPARPLAESTRDFWAKAKLPKGGVVAAALGAQTLTLREIRHPLKEPDKVAQTIRFEAEPYLAMPLEQAILQYRILGEQEGGSRVLLLAAPKERLGATLAGWREAGLDPQKVVADATALWNCYAAFGAEAAKGPVLFLDLGAQKTLLAVFEGRALRLLRVLRVGFAAPPEGTDPGEALKAAVDILAQEARRSWAAVGVQEGHSQVLLTGGGSLDPGIPKLLAERFRCPVGRFRFLERLRHALPAQRVEAFEALGACAVGAALAAAGSDAAGVDFRQEEFRYRGRLPRLAGPAAAAALAASAFLAVLGFDCRTRAAAWGDYLDRLRQRQQEARELIVAGLGAQGGKEDGGALAEILLSGERPLDEVLDLAREQLAQKQQAGAGAHDLASVLDLIRELFQRIPSGIELTVTELQAAQNGVTLKGLMPDENAIWSLPDAVNRAPSPLEAAPTNAQAQPDGSFAFVLSAKRRQP